MAHLIRSDAVASRLALAAPAPRHVAESANREPAPQRPKAALSGVLQRATMDPLSLTHADATQLQRTIGNAALAQLTTNMAAGASSAGTADKREALAGGARDNRTGLPDQLKTGIERLSGLAMDDVRVHTNSSRPAQLQALAYTRGSDIFVGPGQERHLAHEAWHVVQQKQGRVKPTLQMNDVAINDDDALESEATDWGARASQQATSPASEIPIRPPRTSDPAPVQRLVGFEIEAHHLPVSDRSDDPVKRVVNCLGASPDQQMPPGGDGRWHRVFDTNSVLHTTLSEERKAWRESATKHKRDIATAYFAVIPEYVTAPFDERTDDRYIVPAKWRFIGSAHTVYGLDDMNTAIAAVADEIAELRAAAQDFGEVQIGVPPVEDWIAAAEYFGIDGPEDFAKDSRARVSSFVRTDLNYVQATVGILPEKITSFLDQAADQANFNDSGINLPVSAADPAARKLLQYNLVGGTMSLVDKRIHDLVFNDLTVAKARAPDPSNDSDESAPLVAATESGPLPTSKPDEKTALEGVLRLILYVTAGNMLWYTKYKIGGITKNMVSFLPKTPLNAVVKALPYDVSPARLNTFFFPSKFRTVLSKVYDVHLGIGATVQENLDGAYPLSRAEIEGTKAGSNLGTGSVRDYLSRVLSGSSDPAHRDWGLEALGPEKPERGGREGIATRNWFWQNQRTRAVVLEMRHAIVKIPTTQLGTFAANIVKLVHGAHD